MLKFEKGVREDLIRRLEVYCSREGRKPTFLSIGADDVFTDSLLTYLVKRGCWQGAVVRSCLATVSVSEQDLRKTAGIIFLGYAENVTEGPVTLRVLDEGWHESQSLTGTPKTSDSEETQFRAEAIIGLVQATGLPHPDLISIQVDGLPARYLPELEMSANLPAAIMFQYKNYPGEKKTLLRKKFEALGYGVIAMRRTTFVVRAEIMHSLDTALLQCAQDEIVRLAQDNRTLAEGAKEREATRYPTISLRTADPKTAADAKPAQPTGICQPGSSPLRRWYFCINEQGLSKEFRSVRVAVTSARKNTTLEAYCIYDGAECKETEWLRQENVTVIQRKPSLEAELKPAYGEKYDTFRGHWLRVDLPEIETQEEYILYTDIDVMFLQDPRASVFSPDYMAVCEERVIGDRGHFNSGVLVMNLPQLRAVRPWLVQQIRHRLSNNFRYPTHDQKSLNDFFLGQVAWMDPKFNWKPYWGHNRDAAIIHFHGPKPWHVKAIREGKAGNMKPALKLLYDSNKDGYEKYIEIFNEFLGYSV